MPPPCAKALAPTNPQSLHTGTLPGNPARTTHTPLRKCRTLADLIRFRTIKLSEIILPHCKDLCRGGYIMCNGKLNKEYRQWLRSFVSLNWYEEAVKFIFNFVSKTSEL